MEFADDAVEALGEVMRAVSEGKISPSEGAAMATLINSYTQRDRYGRPGEKNGLARGPNKRGSLSMSQTCSAGEPGRGLCSHLDVAEFEERLENIEKDLRALKP